MLETVARRLLRAVFGGGSDISAANPLQVYDPAVEEKVKYTEDSCGNKHRWCKLIELETES